MQETKPRSHLTYQDRCEIEALLCQRKSLRYIASQLKKNPSTISREIKRHTIHQETESPYCALVKECKLRHICGNRLCTKMCKHCWQKDCYKKCSDYIPTYCDEKINHLNLCNGCDKIHRECHFDTDVYKASKAEKEYRKTLIESRNGFDLTYEELEKINTIVSPLIKLGQSPYHVITTHKDELPASESTIRRLINNSELDVRNIDLRDKVKRRQRKPRKMKNEIVSQSKLHHLYEDYLKYIGENEVNVVQMDCVEGTKDSESVLLTLHLPASHFQLALIMEHHTSECVINTLDKVEQSLGKELFAEIFEVILTDNGHEFMDIEQMERSVFEGQRTKVYFCEPNHSNQKGACENNHKYIRYIIPKGTDMDKFNQMDISTMMNHVNSFKRKSLFGKSPYEIASAVLPEDFFIMLGLEEIPADEVNLTPSLLSK